VEDLLEFLKDECGGVTADGLKQMGIAKFGTRKRVLQALLEVGDPAVAAVSVQAQVQVQAQAQAQAQAHEEEEKKAQDKAKVQSGPCITVQIHNATGLMDTQLFGAQVPLATQTCHQQGRRSHVAGLLCRIPISRFLSLMLQRSLSTSGAAARSRCGEKKKKKSWFYRLTRAPRREAQVRFAARCLARNARH
jgi:hypothetical protein